MSCSLTHVALTNLSAVNKPAGATSAQVLRDLQKHFNPSYLFAPWIAHNASESKKASNYRRKNRKPRGQVKIGHGGTLDPIATGVLIAGIGSGTKALSQFLECTKSYETVVLFGAATDTYDRVGKIIGRKPFEHVTETKVLEALAQFRGDIMQRPPIYSALHADGKRFYEYAREGKPLPFEIQKRPVKVLKMELVEWMPGGTHNYKWPEADAGLEEKTVAEKLLDVATEVSSTSDSLKRKALSPGSDEDTDRGQKRSKAGEETVEAIKDRTTAPANEISSKNSPTDDFNEGNATNITGASSPRTGEALSKTPTDLSTPQPPAAKIRMTVGSGFYVRSLCHDLGEAVGSLAFMSELERTQQERFVIGQNVFEYSDLEKGEIVWGPKVEAMLDDWSSGSNDKP